MNILLLLFMFKSYLQITSFMVKTPTKSTPDHAARPPKRASRVVQYVVSSDEEGAGEPEPAPAKAASVQNVMPEASVEGVTAVVSPLLEGANESSVPVSASLTLAFSPPVAAAHKPSSDALNAPCPSLGRWNLAAHQRSGFEKYSIGWPSWR